jgi:hypothetical protein
MTAFAAAPAGCLASPRAAPHARHAPQRLRCDLLVSTPAAACAARAPRARLGAARSSTAAAAARSSRVLAAAATASAGGDGVPEGSGAEETWSPVGSQDPLFDAADELVQAVTSRAPGDGKGRNIMARDRARSCLCACVARLLTRAPCCR